MRLEGEANMRNKTLINEANKILESLRRLQDRCYKLICKYNNEAKEEAPEHIEELKNALYDLSDYDLEDAIYNAQVEEGM